MGKFIVAFFFVALFLGLPIAWVLGISSTIWLWVEGIDLSIVPSRIQVNINSFVLMAVPFFIMAGDLMGKVGITQRLINLTNIIFGRFKGGLAHVCIYTELIFSGITGSAIADVSALGRIFIPAMEEQKYNKAWAVANLCNATVVGPIIPPSILIVLYGAVTGVSVGAMMLACIGPGIVMGIAQSIYVMVIAKRKNLPSVQIKVTPKEFVKISFDAVPALLMPLIIIVGIFSGIVTPTESAAIAVLYALLLGTVYKTLNFKDIIEISKSTAKESSMLLFITGVSGVLGWVIARTGLATSITTTMVSLTDNANVLVLIILGILFFMGTWMDGAPIVLLVSPIVAPIMQQLGFDPIHFGVVFIVTVSIGLITPPLGVVLFAASSANQVRLESIVKQIWPFIILDVALVLLFTFVPQISTWLPTMAKLM